MKPLQTSLDLKNIILPVHIGYSEQEREKLQDITIHLCIKFKKPPKACETDQLEDTICYKKLTDQITQYCTNRTFNLIEHMGYQLYLFIKAQLPKNSKISLSIVKPRLSSPIESRIFNISD